MNALKILVVDDDSDFAEGLAEILDLRGHLVTVASSGEEALRIFHDTDFDFAFVDIKLPGMTGVESCQAIHELKPGAKVVLMTGYTAQQFQSWTKNSGALDVLQKPFDPRNVLQEIESVVGETA